MDTIHVECPPSTKAAEADMTNKTTDDIIVEQLETIGEEIGFTWRTALAVLALIMCYNAYLCSLNVAAAMLSLVNADLGPDPRYTWVTISWNLGGAIVVTIAGRISDLFGRRYFFLAGSSLLCIGSIVGCTAQSISQMIASGVIFGLGSGCLEMVFGAIQEIVPNRWRMVILGVLDCSGIISQSTPLISWALVERTGTWRSAYYYMLAIQCLALALVFFFYFPPAFKTKHRDDGKSKRELMKELDYIGLFLFIAGCCLFLVGLSWGGTSYPWKSAGTIAPIVVGFCTLVVFVFYESYAKLQYPMFPIRLIKRGRQFSFPLIVIAISGMQYYSNAVLWPRMSQLLWANGDISKGLYSSSLPLGTIIGGLFVIGSHKIGHHRWLLVIAVALQTACVGAMATSTLGNPTRSIILTVIISGCNPPCQLFTMVMICFGLEDQADIGIASGIAGTVRLLFGAVATAIFSNVLNNRYSSLLPGRVANSVSSFNLPSEDIARLIAAARLNSAAAFAKVPGITPVIKATVVLANKHAYLDASRLAFYIAVSFGVLAVIAAICTADIDKRKYNKHTVAILETEHKAVISKTDEDVVV